MDTLHYTLTCLFAKQIVIFIIRILDLQKS